MMIFVVLPILFTCLLLVCKQFVISLFPVEFFQFIVGCTNYCSSFIITSSFAYTRTCELIFVVLTLNPITINYAKSNYFNIHTYIFPYVTSFITIISCRAYI